MGVTWKQGGGITGSVQRGEISGDDITQAEQPLEKEKTLSRMTVAELRDKAQELGIDASDMKRDEIIEAVKAKMAESVASKQESKPSEGEQANQEQKPAEGEEQEANQE